MVGLKRRLVLIAVLVVVPLIVAGVAWWQMRGLPDREFYEDTLPLLEAAIYDGVPPTHVPADVQGVVRAREAEVRRLIETVPRRQLVADYNRVKRFPALRYVPSSSTAALVLALFAAVAGVSGLVFLSVAARRSMESRDALYLWFGRGMRLLPLMLLGVSLPLILSLIGVGISSVLRGYASVAGISQMDIAIAVSVVLLAVLAGSLALKIRAVFRRVFDADPHVVPGTPLSPETAPAVWEMAADVARRGNLPMPECIAMGFDAGFYVTRGLARDATGADARTTLYLYLPLMLVMEEDELRSVVAHELGHLRSADLEYREKFSVIYLSAYETIRLLVADRGGDEFSQLVLTAAEKLALFFLDSFHAADMHWSRERELAADRIAASVAGGEAAALALVRTALYMPHIQGFLEEYRLRGGAGNLLAVLGERLAKVAPAPLASVLEEEQPHPFDTHPCLRERLANFGAGREASLGEKAAAIRPGALLARLGL